MSDTVYDGVMCDLETTDVDPARGHIIQIAAVKFNIQTREVSHDFFDRCLFPTPNRRWEEGTRDWWLKRKDVLQGIMNRMEPALPVLEAFRDWVGPGNVTFFGKPTHFDFSFLQSMFKDQGMQIPFHYRLATDMNSFARGRYWPEEPPQWEKILPFEGPPHNALYDALHQLKVLYKIMDGGKPE